MTIDEAIAHAREVAEEQRKDNENCKYKSEYGCKGCADYYSKPCIECSKEHDQLAEWLEELKELRNMTASHLYAVAFNRGYLKAEKEVREKAIDDFVNACKEDISCQTFGLHTNGIERIAEKLKAGGKKNDL